MKEIPVSKGKCFAVVDDADFEWLSGFNWYLCHGYPTTALNFVTESGLRGREPTTMHKLLLGCTLANMVIDHRDRNKMNHQRANLRVVTRSVNMANSDYCNKYKNVV